MKAQLPTIWVICMLSSIHSVGQQNPYALWEKAVNIATQNETWIPGLIYELENTYNHAGELKEEVARKIRVILEGDELQLNLITSLINGEDHIHEEKGKVESMDIRNIDEMEHPFAPDLQGNITVLNKFNIRGHTSYVVFPYRQHVEGVEWKGEAWISRHTGIPVKVEFSTKSPIERDEYTLTNLKGIIYYKYDDPEEWYPKEIHYNMDIETEIFPFYTFHGQVKSTIHLSNYFKP